MIDDKEIIKIFVIKTKSNKLKSKLTTYNINKHKDEYEYLLKRYSDSSSINESLYRIINNIEIRPICKICGNNVKFVGGAVSGHFKNTCEDKKCKQLNYERLIKEKYGVCNVFKLNSVKEKSKRSLINKYGVDNCAKSKEIQKRINETCMKRYGHRFKLQFETNPFSWPEVKEKIKQTMLDKYGVENIRNSKYYKDSVKNPFYDKDIQNKIKQTMLEKYGVEYFSQTEQWKTLWKNQDFLKNKLEKEYITKKKNHSHGPNSKEEAKIFELLKTKWPNTQNQYYDRKLYPFKCDFYIPEIDTWIEYQGYYTHGSHPYNPLSIDDKKQLDNLYSKCYELAIKTWTITDPLKRFTAKSNNLNYLEFFNIKDFLIWFDKQI